MQSTYPEFLDVQQPGYLKGLVGMWELWINTRGGQISSPEDFQVEKDEMSRGIGTHGSSQWVVPLYPCSNCSHLFRSMLLFFASCCSSQSRKPGGLSKICSSKLAWLCLPVHAPPNAGCDHCPSLRPSWWMFCNAVPRPILHHFWSLLLSPLSCTHCQRNLIPLPWLLHSRSDLR